MTDMIACRRIRQSLGVYVIGAIDPAERSVVDSHLTGCADCREELAGLAGLPALLGRVPVEEAAQIAGIHPQRGVPGDQSAGELLDPLLTRMAKSRRVHRWRSLAAAAAVVLLAAGAAIGVIRVGGGPAGGVARVHWEQVHGTDVGTHVSADVKYTGMTWGTRLDVQVAGIPAGTICELWVTGTDGKRWPAGSWTVDSPWQKGTWYPASSAAPLGGVRGFEITAGRAVLVDVPA
jgi:anti-sigma factor RsiW